MEILQLEGVIAAEAGCASQGCPCKRDVVIGLTQHR